MLVQTLLFVSATGCGVCLATAKKTAETRKSWRAYTPPAASREEEEKDYFIDKSQVRDIDLKTWNSTKYKK